MMLLRAPIHHPVIVTYKSAPESVPEPNEPNEPKDPQDPKDTQKPKKQKHKKRKREGSSHAEKDPEEGEEKESTPLKRKKTTASKKSTPKKPSHTHTDQPNSPPHSTQTSPQKTPPRSPPKQPTPKSTPTPKPKSPPKTSTPNQTDTDNIFQDQLNDPIPDKIISPENTPFTQPEPTNHPKEAPETFEADFETGSFPESFPYDSPLPEEDPSSFLFTHAHLREIRSTLNVITRLIGHPSSGSSTSTFSGAADISAIASNLQAIKTDVSSLSMGLEKVNSRLDSFETNIATIVSEAVTKAINDEKFKTLEAALTKLQGEVKVLGKDLQDSFNAKTESWEIAQQNVQTLQAREHELMLTIGLLENQVSELNKANSTYDDLSILSNKVDTIFSEVKTTLKPMQALLEKMGFVKFFPGAAGDSGQLKSTGPSGGDQGTSQTNQQKPPGPGQHPSSAFRKLSGSGPQQKSTGDSSYVQDLHKAQKLQAIAADHRNKRQMKFDQATEPTKLDGMAIREIGFMEGIEFDLSPRRSYSTSKTHSQVYDLPMTYEAFSWNFYSLGNIEKEPLTDLLVQFYTEVAQGTGVWRQDMIRKIAVESIPDLYKGQIQNYNIFLYRGKDNELQKVTLADFPLMNPYDIISIHRLCNKFLNNIPEGLRLSSKAFVRQYLLAVAHRDNELRLLLKKKPKEPVHSLPEKLDINSLPGNRDGLIINEPIWGIVFTERKTATRTVHTKFFYMDDKSLCSSNFIREIIRRATVCPHNKVVDREEASHFLFWYTTIRTMLINVLPEAFSPEELAPVLGRPQ